MNKRWRWLALVLTFPAATVIAAPEIQLGTPETYCVTYCYVRIPFKVMHFDPGHRTGRIFCELDAEITAKLPVHAGEAKSKMLHASSIGVFSNKAEGAIGDVEMDTGVIKNYFVDAKVKSVQCHL